MPVASVEMCSYKSLMKAARKSHSDVFVAFMSCVSTPAQLATVASEHHGLKED